MRSLAVLIALLGAALPVFAQQQPALNEQIDVNAVLLDVIVTDAKGNQILGLSKEDFEVKENGVAQNIDSVDYFTNRRLLDSREQDAPFKVERVREERYFIFFFDKPQDGFLFDRLNSARSAVRDFIRNQMKEGDQVAITGHDVRLKVYTDFTSDKAQLERALEDSAKFSKGVTEGDGPILKTVGRNTLIKKTGTVYQALAALADSTKGIRARKNLVLFSPGIADINERQMAGMLVERSRYLDDALQSLNAANVSVYGVQLLQQGIDGDLSQPLYHQRLNELATSTGGKYFQFNTSFAPAINQVEETNAGYYLLTYRSGKTRGQRGFQKVQVSVKGQPQLRVTSRAGYEFGG